MVSNKNIKIFIKYVLGPVLFIWLSWSIYQQIMHQPQLEQSWIAIKQSFQSYKILFLVLAIVFIFFNWGIEAFKWKLLARHIYPITFFQSLKAVLSGVSFAVILPNRVGEYLGRMMYMPDGSRLKTISAAIVGSISQLLVTFYIGILGLVVLKQPLLDAFPDLDVWYPFFLYGMIFTSSLLTLFYFNVQALVYLFKKWFRTDRYLYLVESLSRLESRFLLQLLLLSLVRYGVFALQYIFVFQLFNVDVPIVTGFWIMSLVFLALAVIPSIALVELGLRGEISLMLLGMFTANHLGVGLTSVTVWFMNLIFPAILGSLFLLNIRFFNRKGERTSRKVAYEMSESEK